MNKKINSAEWMREQRIRIDEEDKGLSWKEKREKTRKLLEKDPYFSKLVKKIQSPEDLKADIVGESRAEYKSD